MTPEDATNLLLAIMYDGELAEAHETVRRLRAAKIRWSEGTRYTDGKRETICASAKNGFVTSERGESYELGEVVEILLDAWVRYYRVDEGGDEDIDLDPVNIRLEVTSPGYRATLTFNTPHGLFWRIDYEWKSPEQLAYEEANSGNRLARVWPSLRGPYMWSSRTVDEHSLTKIADCLRGFEWQDEFDEVVPAYEIADEKESVSA